MPSKKLSTAEQRILLFLHRWLRPIRIGDLKHHMTMQHSTLNSIMKRLHNAGFVEWVKYGPVSLTEQGRNAISHIDRHTHLTASFLIETLGMTEKQAQAEAMLIAAVCSCEMINHIARKFQFTSCPVCGSPIDCSEDAYCGQE